jgi:hypothetical protein
MPQEKERMRLLLQLLREQRFMLETEARVITIYVDR